jgi:hypothetical protein
MKGVFLRRLSCSNAGWDGLTWSLWRWIGIDGAVHPGLVILCAVVVKCFRWLAVIGLLGGAVSGFSQTTAETYHDRADQALESFLLKFWDGGAQYLRNRYPSTDNQLTGYWTYAHGWEAVMDGVERSGRQEYYGWIESFYIGQNERGWIVAHYDDECWMTMALLRAYDLTGNGRSWCSRILKRAGTRVVAGRFGAACGGTKRTRKKRRHRMRARLWLGRGFISARVTSLISISRGRSIRIGIATW